MKFGQALFGFQGRIRRSIYIASLIGVAFVEITALVVMSVVAQADKWSPVNVSIAPKTFEAGFLPLSIGFLCLLIFILVFWVHIALGVKRCHDRGYPGAMVLVGLIPVLGWAWAFIDLWFIDGTPGQNRYGPSPKALSSSPHSAQSALNAVGGVRGVEDGLRSSNTAMASALIMGDEHFYEAAAAELDNGIAHKGVWTKVLVQNDGDENRARLNYIRHRVNQMTAEAAKINHVIQPRLNDKFSGEAPAVIIAIFLIVGIAIGWSYINTFSKAATSSAKTKFSGSSAGATWILAKSTGCKVWDPFPIPNESVTWSGSCVDGVATGPGIEQWYFPNGSLGNLLDGNIRVGGDNFQGNVIVNYPDGSKYDGILLSGLRSGLGTLTYRDGRVWVGTWLAGQKETGRYINKSTGHQHSAHAASQNAIAKTSDPVDDAIEAMNSAVPMQNSGAPAGKNANAPAAADPVDDAIEAMNTGVPMKNTGANPAPHAQLAPSGKQ